MYVICDIYVCLIKVSAAHCIVVDIRCFVVGRIFQCLGYFKAYVNACLRKYAIHITLQI